MVLGDLVGMEMGRRVLRVGLVVFHALEGGSAQRNVPTVQDGGDLVGESLLVKRVGLGLDLGRIGESGERREEAREARVVAVDVEWVLGLIVVIGCLLSFFLHIEKHGIQIVRTLKKGLNPISIQKLKFHSAYVFTALKAGLFTGTLALAVKGLFARFEEVV
ncbi:hypothetical protein AAC387_Pa07g1734 [Persea americana]